MGTGYVPRPPEVESCSLFSREHAYVDFPLCVSHNSLSFALMAASGAQKASAATRVCDCLLGRKLPTPSPRLRDPAGFVEDTVRGDRFPSLHSPRTTRVTARTARPSFIRKLDRFFKPPPR